MYFICVLFPRLVSIRGKHLSPLRIQSLLLSWTHVSIKARQKQEQHLPSYVIVLGLETHLLPFGNPPRLIFYCLYLSSAKVLNKVFEEEKEEKRSVTIQPTGSSIQWGRDSWCPRLWYFPIPIQSITSISSSSYVCKKAMSVVRFHENFLAQHVLYESLPDHWCSNI